MSKFDVDYDQLHNKIYKKAYKLSEVEHKIEKIGFDIVKFRNSDENANLWQIQKADDGEYIIALYQEIDDTVKASEWNVAVNKTANSIQISYRQDPLIVLNLKQLGVPAQELSKIAEYLPEKLTNNKKMVKLLLNDLDEATKQSVLAKYPELL